MSGSKSDAIQTRGGPACATIIRVLVVDDSAFVRKIVREMLSGNPYIEVVGIASEGEEALRKAAEIKPDVITCDLTMRGMGGVEFVRAQMSKRPTPILVVSASAGDAEDVLEAISAGAVDFIQKPTALASEELLMLREELIAKVKAAARAPVENLHIVAVDQKPVTVPTRQTRNFDAVLIGISTGGPQALRLLLPQLSVEFPAPILIVLHMPVGYTAMFAAKLNELSALEVVEAQDGQLLRPGLAVLAQAGRHLMISRTARGDLVTRLGTQPAHKPHCPSVDVLFESGAAVFGARALAVVMTGMGSDGREGAAWIKAKGGTVLTEAEESCVIYGMPRSVDEAGLSDAKIPLGKMAEEITKRL